MRGLVRCAPPTHLHDRRCPLRTGMSGHRANADTAPRSSSDIWVQNKRNQLADGGWWGRRVRFGSNTDGRDCAVASQSTYGASIHDGGSSCSDWQRRGGHQSVVHTPTAPGMVRRQRTWGRAEARSRNGSNRRMPSVPATVMLLKASPSCTAKAGDTNRSPNEGRSDTCAWVPCHISDLLQQARKRQA